MAKKWSKKMVDDFVEEHCGETFTLLDEFPFSEDAKKKIDNAFYDDDNYTDSDVCDLILELAYNECGT